MAANAQSSQRGRGRGRGRANSVYTYSRTPAVRLGRNVTPLPAQPWIRFGANSEPEGVMRIGHLFSDSSPEEIVQYVNAALIRLGAKADRHLEKWARQDQPQRRVWPEKPFQSIRVTVVPATKLSEAVDYFCHRAFKSLGGRWTNLTCCRFYPGGVGKVNLAPDAHEYLGLTPTDIGRLRAEASSHGEVKGRSNDRERMRAKLNEAIETSYADAGIPRVLRVSAITITPNAKLNNSNRATVQAVFASKPMARAAAELCPELFRMPTAAAQETLVRAMDEHDAIAEFLRSKFDAVPSVLPAAHGALRLAFPSTERRDGALAAVRSKFSIDLTKQPSRNGSGVATPPLDYARAIVISRWHDRSLTTPVRGAISPATIDFFASRVKTLKIPVEQRLWVHRAPLEGRNADDHSMEVAAIVYQVAAGADFAQILEVMRTLGRELETGQPYQKVLVRPYQAPRPTTEAPAQQERGRERSTIRMHTERNQQPRSTRPANDSGSAEAPEAQRTAPRRPRNGLNGTRALVFTRKRPPNTDRNNTDNAPRAVYLSDEHVDRIVEHVKEVSGEVANHSTIPRNRHRATTGLIVEFASVDKREAFLKDHTPTKGKKRAANARAEAVIDSVRYSVGRYNGNYCEEVKSVVQAAKERSEETKRLHNDAAADEPNSVPTAPKRNAARAQRQRASAEGNAQKAAAAKVPKPHTMLVRALVPDKKLWTSATDTEPAASLPRRLVVSKTRTLPKETLRAGLKALAKEGAAQSIFAYAVSDPRGQCRGLQAFWPYKTQAAEIRQRTNAMLLAMNLNVETTIVNSHWVSPLGRNAQLTIVGLDTRKHPNARMAILRRALDPRIGIPPPLTVSEPGHRLVLTYATADMAHRALVYLNHLDKDHMTWAYQPELVPTKL